MINVDEISRPVLFEHANEKYNYWGKGSSFIIASEHNYYWVTASHVIKKIQGKIEDLRIYPLDNSQISLPFNEKYVIHQGLTDDEEYKDILILKIDLNEFDQFGDSPLAAQDIGKWTLPAEQLKQDDELWIIGYPTENNYIDYDSREINNTRCVLRAIYRGSSVSILCHELSIETSIDLKDYDGLSGSPVFYREIRSIDGKQLIYYFLVGMLLRGSKNSGIAHFVNSSIIVDIVNNAEKTT